MPHSGYSAMHKKNPSLKKLLILMVYLSIIQLMFSEKNRYVSVCLFGVLESVFFGFRRCLM